MQHAIAKTVSIDAAPDFAELMRRARELAPKLRQRAEESERLRRVPDESIADFVRSGVLRSCQPRRFGGSGLSWDSVCDIAIELAKGDASQAWVANIYADMAYFMALFDEQAQREVWDINPDAIIAGSIIPQGNSTERVQGGYRLSGTWGFTSGVHHADWNVFAERAQDSSGCMRVFHFLMPASVCSIVDDWHTVGMSGTGSASVALDNVFVPDYRIICHDDVMTGTTPGTRLNREPLYRMPLPGYAQLALACVPIGAAMGMLEEFGTTLRTSLAAANPQPGLELQLGHYSRCDAEMKAARLLILEVSRANMCVLDQGLALTEDNAACSMRDAAYAVSLARQVSMRLFEASGGRGIYLKAPMQRMFRDVQAGSAHASLNWDRSSIRYARNRLA